MGAEDLLKVALGVADVVVAEQVVEGVMDERRARELAEREAIADKVCPHTVLTPHWDSVRDMGHEDRATSFTCDACERSFTPDEAKAARANVAEKMKQG